MGSAGPQQDDEKGWGGWDARALTTFFPPDMRPQVGYQDVRSFGNEAKKDSLTSSVGLCLPET